MASTSSSDCCVKNCDSNLNLKQYPIPKQFNKTYAWLKRIDRLDLLESYKKIDYFVCEKHFKENDFQSHGDTKTLKVSALPNLICDELPSDRNTAESNSNVVNNPPISAASEDYTPMIYDDPLDISTDTQNQLTDNQLNEESVIQSVHGIANQSDTLNSRAKVIPLYLRKSNVVDLTSVTHDETKKDEVNKDNHNADDDLVCYKLPLKSPDLYLKSYYFNNFALYHELFHTYNVLRSSFGLPSDNCMNYFIKNRIGNEADFWELLKRRVQRMNDLQRICFVSIASINLTKECCYNPESDRLEGVQDIDGIPKNVVANQATVLSVHGMLFEWQQRIDYALTNNKYDNESNFVCWVKRIISNLQNIGLNVKAIVADNNIMPKIYQKHIYSFVNHAEGMVWFRNILMNKYYDSGYNHWNFIWTIYKNEMKRCRRLVPKLTASHMYPSEKDFNNPLRADEIFDRSMVNALSAYIDIKLLSKDAVNTIKYIDSVIIIKDLSFNVACKYSTFNQFQFDVSKSKIFLDGILSSIKEKSKQNKDFISFIQELQSNLDNLLFLYKEMSTVGTSFNCIRVPSLKMFKEFRETAFVSQDTLYYDKFKKIFDEHRCKDLMQVTLIESTSKDISLFLRLVDGNTKKFTYTKDIDCKSVIIPKKIYYKGMDHIVGVSKLKSCEMSRQIIAKIMIKICKANKQMCDKFVNDDNEPSEFLLSYIDSMQKVFPNILPRINVMNSLLEKMEHYDKVLNIPQLYIVKIVYFLSMINNHKMANIFSASETIENEV